MTHMVKTKLSAVKKDGKLVFQDLAALGGHMNTFKDGQELEVTIDKRRRPRTSGAPGENANHNGYYWGVVVKMVADELGYFEKHDIDRVEEWIQVNVNNVVRMPDGKEVAAGTKWMDTAQFADHCSKARMWASMPGAVCEHGMYIPEPYEVVVEGYNQRS